MLRAISSDRDAVLDIYRRRLGRGRARLAEFLGAPMEISSQGSTITTDDGRELLDCGGYAVFLLGHRNPEITEAVVEQLRRHPMASRVLVEPRVAEAAEALCQLAPDGLENVQFTNSGAEATELALKLARLHGKTELVTMSGGYHGKTLGALSVTPNRHYQQPFAPLFDASVIAYGDLEALERRLTASHGDACVIVEPVQGEGGVNLPPAGYLAGLEQLCRQYEAMLVVDEIQTGLGRCGTWWASHPEITAPDLMLVGKALSGGVLPVAAVLARPEVFAPLGDDPTLHSSTFAAAPAAMAAAAATLEVLRDGTLISHVDQLGRELLDRLDQQLTPYRDVVREVRGRGLLIGVELTRPDLVAEIVCDLLDDGILANHSLNGRGVLRLTPPATLAAADIGRIVDSLTTAVRRHHRATPAGPPMTAAA